MRRARKAQAQPAFNPNVSYGDEHGALDVNGSVLRRRNSVSTDAAAVFRDKEWFLSTMPRKKVDTTMQLKAKPGDWVIRESESQAGALVLTFKALNGQVHSKRIKFANGLFCFDGDKKAYATIPLLVKADKNINRAAGDLFGRTTLPRRTSSKGTKALRAVEAIAASQPQNAQRRKQPQPQPQRPPVTTRTPSRERSESLSGFGGFEDTSPEPVASAPITKQNSEGFGGFGDDEPAPPPPARVSRAGSEAFGGFDDDEPAASPPPPAPAPSKALKPGEFLVNCEETDLGSALGLIGEGSIKVHETKRQFTVTNHYDSSAKESWTVTALRRYGREEGKFYFEAGRRCASGEGMMYLVSDDCDEIFEKVDAHVRSAREEMKAKKAAKQKVIQEANAKRAAEAAEKAAEEEKRAAVAQAAHAKEAEAEAHRRIEEKKRAEIQAQKDAEEAERAAAVEKTRQEEARKARSKGNKKESIYGTVADAMATAAAMTETVSEASKKAMAQKGPAVQAKKKGPPVQARKKVATAAAEAPAEAPAADPYAGMFQEEEWGAGKSRIWKALNPKPLAYQSRKDKQEMEDGKVDMGIVGSRDFNAVRDLAADVGGGLADNSADAELGEDDGGFESAFGMDEEAHVDEDMHDNVSSDEDEDYDPNAPVDDSELVNDDVTSFLGVLELNRAKRAKEEAENKAKLAAEYKARKAVEQVALDKELAIIAAQKKIENAEAERLKDIAVLDAQKSAESLVFDFSWG